MKGNIPNDLMEKMLSPENLNAWNDSAILLFDDNISQNLKNASGDLSDVSDNSDGLRFSLEDYSECDQDDILAVLRPFVGRNIVTAHTWRKDYALYQHFTQFITS